MTQTEQTTAFINDLEAVIDRYRAEFDMNCASVIGALEIIKLSIFNEGVAIKPDDEPDDESEPQEL